MPTGLAQHEGEANYVICTTHVEQERILGKTSLPYTLTSEGSAGALWLHRSIVEHPLINIAVSFFI